MKERNASKKITRYISFAAVAIILVGWPQGHSNAALGTSDEKAEGRAFNLERVPCPDKPINANIEVRATKEVVADPDNLVVFACKGDTITWFTKDLKLQVVVAFEGEKAEELFQGEPTLFLSGPDGRTATGIVEKQKNHALFTNILYG